MTRRVILGDLPGGDYGLRVSKPGYDALSTSLQPKQVSFDSRWTRSARVHMTGKVTGDSTVYFGKTFSTPPLVYVVFTDSQGRYRNYSVYGQFSDGNLEVRTLRDRVTFNLTSDAYPATYVVVAI